MVHIYIVRLLINQVRGKTPYSSMILLILIFCYLSQFILQGFGTLPFPMGHNSQNQNFSWAVQFVQSSQNHIFFHFPWCSISLAQSTNFTFQAGSLSTRSYACVFHYPSRWWLYLKNRFWREWKTKNEATKLTDILRYKPNDLIT